jgi:hypothetical protein
MREKKFFSTLYLINQIVRKYSLYLYSVLSGFININQKKIFFMKCQSINRKKQTA